MWDAGACTVALASASLLAKPMLLAKNGNFLGVLILPKNKKHTLTCQGGTGCYRFNYQPGS